LWEHDGLAGLRFGGAYFMLQDIDVPEWQANQMITLEVTDLDSYWAELQGKDLARAFAGVRLRPPTRFPWGREVHIIDPGGVCWHVRQSASEGPAGGFSGTRQLDIDRANTASPDGRRSYLYERCRVPSPTFWPAHSGEKSPLPRPSALARRGARADAARGKAGAAALSGPSSRIRRLTMPRAG